MYTGATVSFVEFCHSKAKLVFKPELYVEIVATYYAPKGGSPQLVFRIWAEQFLGEMT